jgi:hypothetical protein
VNIAAVSITAAAVHWSSDSLEQAAVSIFMSCCLVEGLFILVSTLLVALLLLQAARHAG